MRLWHFKLIPVLPKDMLVSQWRECIAIKRQWEKGTLKHRLVSYVKKYNKGYFKYYCYMVAQELKIRGINFNKQYLDEINEFCKIDPSVSYFSYPEHNVRYLTQCYYNLQEKFDRGIVNDKEWSKINKSFRRKMK